MSTVACPYCYKKISQARLAFQCLGRGVPGNPKRCTRARDEERVRHTGVADPMLPVFVPQNRNPLGSGSKAACPNCSGQTNARACPVCHTPLSATFASSKSPLIGMVGGKGAGKTVYTAVLHHQLRTAVRKLYNADIRLVGGQQGGTGSARQWLEANEEQLFEDGKLFAGTSAARDGMRAPVVIQWRQPRRRMGIQQTFDTTVLSFYDAAGEDLTSVDKVRDQEYLGVSNGLVLLLDPWQLPGAAERIDVPRAKVTGAAPPLEVLGSITDMLQLAHGVKRGKISVPLAVVFAKMDAFFPVLGPHHPLMRPAMTDSGYDETAGQDTHEHVRALLHEYGADDIDVALEHNYSSFRYFTVSALGGAPDYDRDVVDRGVHPFRVEEPLLWLLHRFRVLGGRW